MLWVFFSFGKVKLLKALMKLINVWDGLSHYSFSVIFAKFISQVFFFCGMEKRAYFWFITTKFVTADSFVLVWMIKSLNCSVTLVTLETLWTLVPSDTLLQNFTVLRWVLKNFRWPSKVPHVVCINATLTIVRVFLCGTPSCFVHKHVKHKTIFI